MKTAPPTAPGLEDAALASLARSLGHPARVRILRLLLARKTCVAGSLADELPLAASTVSQHLAVLKRAGLIVGEVDGPRRCYWPNREKLGELRALLADLGPLHESVDTECCT